MMNTSKPSDSAATASISQLKSTWSQLNDVDRAIAVAALRKIGISNRKIAREVGSSESNLRHLLKILDASREDQELARNQQITSAELIRRGHAAKLQRAEKQREVTAVKNARGARRAADLICNWIVEQQISGPDGELMIEHVRREFALRELSRCLPVLPDRDYPPLAELIQRSKPDRPRDGNATSVSWHEEWLCRWTFFAFRDPTVRDAALDQALERQWAR